MSSVSLTENEFKFINNYINYTVESPPDRCLVCIFLATVFVIIFILGVPANAVVIWTAGFKVKKSVNTTWYLSLAVSNVMLCFSLPFDVVYSLGDDWIFGLFMCKFVPFIMFLNMFSSIFILVVISVDRCVTDLFPAWGQNHRTIKKASVTVTLVWIISAVLSVPALIFCDVFPNYSGETQYCYYNYKHDQDHTAVVSCQFVFGYLIPFVIIIICYSIIMKINQSARFKKPLKIMTALIVTFFICWLLFHTSNFMEINDTKYDENSRTVTYVVGITLSSANSCVNPFIYAFIGRDSKIKWYRFLSKIENALVEEDEDQNGV